MARSKSHSTFIVGGTFRNKNGTKLVQKRSWEMLRIFSDHIAFPIFGMLQDQNDKTLEYPLPDSVQIVEIPLIHGKVKLINTVLGKVLNSDIKNTIDDCYAVYFRQPLWECWDIFRYTRSKNKKIIVSYHGDWPDGLRRSESLGLKHLLYLALAQYIAHIFKTMAHQSEIAFCVGDVLEKKYGRLAKKSVIFANFLHSEEDILKQARPLNEVPPYNILFVGGFEEYKGIKYLIQAIAFLRRQGFDCKLTLVGSGSLEQYLRSLTIKNRIVENVEWLGYIQHGSKLMKIYRQADLFVLPSIASEGTAKVLMEAMSQGVPIIATDIGNTKNMLENGQYGIIVPPADSKTLSLAIKQVLDNKEVRLTLVKKGLNLAHQSTSNKQKQIVKTALYDSIPEIIGQPEYMTTLQSA